MMKHSSESIPIKRKPRAVSTFLKKTYQLLHELENKDAVRWASNGIGFIVLNQDLFSKEILPRYFKHSNYSSFVRQLNMYNFHKIRESNGESYFHHESFDRFDEHKLSEIKRKPEKKKRKNDESDSEAFSDHEEKENVKLSLVKKVKEDIILPLKNEKHISQMKIEDTKNTRHFFSQQCNGEEENQQERPSWRGLDLDELEDDKISINNEISERLIPRLATRELIYPSNNNLFPFGAGKGQTSTFCLFY